MFLVIKRPTEKPYLINNSSNYSQLKIRTFCIVEKECSPANAAVSSLPPSACFLHQEHGSHSCYGHYLRTDLRTLVAAFSNGKELDFFAFGERN